MAAHPFRWDQPFEQIVAECGPVFDALELVSNNVSRGDAIAGPRPCLRTHPMGATGSSDAHDLDVVGCYFTEFDVPIATVGRLRRAALRSRSGRPRHRPGARLACGPVD